MIPQSYINYYGDQTRWFIGTVVNVNDPLKLGRVRVRIYGVHSSDVQDVPNSYLPWAQTVLPITEGGTSGIGATTGIKENAQVFGIFLDGKSSQLPLVIGSIPKVETISNESKEARGEPTDTVKIADGSVKNNVTDVDARMPGKTNIEKAFNYFISDEGGTRYGPIQACAMIGNFMVEAPQKIYLTGKDGQPLLNSRGGRRFKYTGDIDPNAVSEFKLKTGEMEGSMGIAQWNPAENAGNRLGALRNFAAERNLPWNSMQAQCAFVKHELASEKTRRYYRTDKFMQTQSKAEAAYLFARYYENPASEKGAPPEYPKGDVTPEGWEKRYKSALAVFERFVED